MMVGRSADPDRWQLVEAIFDQAMRAPADEVAPLLERLCAGDTALRTEVEALLRADRQASALLETPGIEAVTYVDGRDTGSRQPAAVLGPGTEVGPYRLIRQIGAGGMGVVYEARDARLGRRVALKFLPAEIGRDPAIRKRFLREARAASSLDHPAICTVHDIGTSPDGRLYIVMALYPGETLQQRLAGGPLPIDEAYRITALLARGLEQAHAAGIVHRDIKPGNVIITEQGDPKILDFGLAKVLGAAALTVSNSSLGTPAYMSPEQARCDPVDVRTDVWSLGAVIYEMLTGRRPFPGDNPPATVAAILSQEPAPVESLCPEVPPELARVVKRALTKDPDQRYQHAGELVAELGSLSGSASSVFALPPSSSINRTTLLGSQTHGPAARLRRGRRPLIAAGLAAALALAGLAVWRATSGGETAAPVKVRPLTFSGHDLEPSASPDGRLVAFSSDRDGASRIWLKQLADGSEAALTTGPDEKPRFVPDGSAVVFIRLEEGASSAYRIGLLDDQARRLIADAIEVDVAPDGSRLAFVRAERGPDGALASAIGICRADGSDQRQLLRLPDRWLRGLRWSADGRRLVALETDPATPLPDARILVVEVATGDVRRIDTAGETGLLTNVTWAGDELLYGAAESALGTASRSSARVVLHDPGSGRQQPLFWWQNLFAMSYYTTFDVVGPGLVVFDDFVSQQGLREVSLDGGRRRPLSTISQAISRDRQPTYHPDGEWVLYSSDRNGNLDLWTISTRTGVERQITQDAAEDWDPTFTPDGRQVVWSTDRSGVLEIWIAERDGGGARQLTATGVGATNPRVTPDGRSVVYSVTDPSAFGIWKMAIEGGQPSLVLPGLFVMPEVSPDGRYLAALTFDYSNSQLKVVDLESGQRLRYEIVNTYHRLSRTQNVVIGRARWLRGDRIAFIGEDDRARLGVYVADFAPQAVSGAWRPLIPFDADCPVETFDLAPDGSRAIVSCQVNRFTINLAEGVPGVG